MPRKNDPRMVSNYGIYLKYGGNVNVWNQVLRVRVGSGAVRVGCTKTSNSVSSLTVKRTLNVLLVT